MKQKKSPKKVASVIKKATRKVTKKATKKATTGKKPSRKKTQWSAVGLISERRKPKEKKVSQNDESLELRTAFEKDYDRILFSTPVRRLADKTQVFPLDSNDSVRTRLTHSHEVSNLAKSIGQALISKKVFPESTSRTIIPILGAIGLAHDLGNPPFGHQGEASIRSWFKKRNIFEGTDFDLNDINDFTKFDGNAQTFRLVTKLQIISDEYGLNLTRETLAALLKYTVSSSNISDTKSASKKHGFFKSEEHIAIEVMKASGFKPGQRHPLTLIMEACDDIAYSVMDVEDSAKKGLISFQDVLAELEHGINRSDEKSLNDYEKLILRVCDKARSADMDHRKQKLSPSELKDISMQMFRVFAVFEMVSAVVEAFEKNSYKILSFDFEKSLMSMSTAKLLCKKLKDFALEHAYKHPTVTKLELEGHNVLHELMDMLWAGIVNRQSSEIVDSKRTDPFSAFAFSCISENYKRVFASPDNKMPLRYKEAQLLTDMISGMTDTYAFNLHGKLKKLLSDGDFKVFDPKHGKILS